MIWRSVAPIGWQVSPSTSTGGHRGPVTSGADRRGSRGRDLDREHDHLERPVWEGDANDLLEATYAFFNGCRILRTLETGSPVISKSLYRGLGTRGPAPTLALGGRVARRVARTTARRSPEDNEVLRVTMGPFVEMVRQRLLSKQRRIPERHVGHEPLGTRPWTRPISTSMAIRRSHGRVPEQQLEVAVGRKSALLPRDRPARRTASRRGDRRPCGRTASSTS